MHETLLERFMQRQSPPPPPPSLISYVDYLNFIRAHYSECSFSIFSRAASAFTIHYYYAVAFNFSCVNWLYCSGKNWFSIQNCRGWRRRKRLCWLCRLSFVPCTVIPKKKNTKPVCRSTHCMPTMTLRWKLCNSLRPFEATLLTFSVFFFFFLSSSRSRCFFGRSVERLCDEH